MSSSGVQVDALSWAASLLGVLTLLRDNIHQR
jgi:hypothetical protein